MKKFEIGIDLSFIRPDHKNGGTESYIRNLMSGFEEIGVSGNIVYFIRRDIYKEYKKDFPKSSFIVYQTRGRHKSGMLLFQTLGIPRLASRYHLLTVFFPAYASGFLPYRNCRAVVNPHDLQHEYCLDNFSIIQRIYRRLIYGLSLLKCSCAIAISDYTENTMHECYPRILDGKVHRIYNPIRFSDTCEKVNGIDFPYILSVNALRRNKNLITLLKAYKKIAGSVRQKLVLTGMNADDGKGLENYIKRNRLENKVILAGFVSDAQLAWLYENADLFVTTSLYEGFGMTPVEAMGHGCPVISSKDTSLYEVTKGLAEYYEPSADENALAEAMVSVLDGKVKIDRDRNRRIMREAYDYRMIAEEYYKFLLEDTG